ncbi:MAG: hypothetical protein IPK72_16120 [Candidatus Eisenbacteria bacterium]|nr:hypothetical protein [Candidatus Eisenbacteria bacterium]
MRRVVPRFTFAAGLAALLALAAGVGPEAARAQENEAPPRRLPPAAAVGLYAGTPSATGLFVTGPVDGSIGLRFGFTGWPNVGILWTPGVEVRFAQEPGTLGTSSAFLFGNLFGGYQKGAETEEKKGMEFGLGYRWFLSDVRGYRWIFSTEAGGLWKSQDAVPIRPSIRFAWLLATR